VTKFHNRDLEEGKISGKRRSEISPLRLDEDDLRNEASTRKRGVVTKAEGKRVKRLANPSLAQGGERKKGADKKKLPR